MSKGNNPLRCKLAISPAATSLRSWTAAGLKGRCRAILAMQSIMALNRFFDKTMDRAMGSDAGRKALLERTPLGGRFKKCAPNVGRMFPFSPRKTAEKEEKN